MTLQQPFAVQDVDLYDLIYSNKDYQAEFKWIKDCFRTFSLNSSHCLEVGAGSGKLTSFMRPLFDSYSVVEPSSHFHSNLNSIYSDDPSFFSFNSTLQDWLVDIEVCTKALSNVSCILANFNVCNYMPMNDFLQALDQLHIFTAEQCCIIFDT